ncbi:MAG: transposase [Dehalococcoidales bacterium]|nr:transposase [Dehalococcoidales bacterium]
MDSLYRLCIPLRTVPGDLLPILLDTTFFEPFALLTASVVVGGRGLPIRWVTYHRHELKAVFARDGRKGKIQETMLSENLIEQRLVDEVWAKVTSGIRAVLVADRGFASADFFQWLLQNMRHFVIRFKADTHITVVNAKGESVTGAAKEVIPVEPGQKRWVEGVIYRKDGAARVNVLVVFDVGQEEPWYLATDSSDPAEGEQLYRWRMREEREYKDCKDQLFLGKKGTRMTVQNVASVARILDALMVLHWFVALIGLQAMKDLPMMDEPRQNSRGGEIDDREDTETEAQIDNRDDASSQGEPEGPAIAPEPKPRIEGALIPHWLRFGCRWVWPKLSKRVAARPAAGIASY